MSAEFFGGTDFQRDRWGRPNIAQGDGTSAAYTRATTMAGTMEDLNGLIGWKQAMTAIGMTRSKSLQASMSFLSYEEDKNKVRNLVDKAFALGGGEDKADIGTAFHSLVEMHHQGIEPKPGVELPDGFGETLEAYKKFVADYGVTVSASEITVVEDEHKVAGTADLVYSFAQDVKTPFGVIPAGHGIIVDVKTGKVSDLSGMKMGMQLAAYSHGKPYNPETGEREPWPVHMEQWVGLVLKVDLETHTVVPWWLDLKAAYDMIPVAVQVREIRKAGKKLITQADVVVEGEEAKPKPKKKAPAKKKPEPVVEEPVVEEPKAPVPLEVVNIEDAAPAPEKPAEQEYEEFSVEHAKVRAAAIRNLGELREVWKEFEKARRRGGSTTEAVAIIAGRSADFQ